ncbi:DEAD/DEAH box helicase family protein [Ruminiclostridium herbifermentans]|uniref:DEAD/DEAH box helicase family protein n=1 Tax=Ruminiclostridium herbifermentans TaxID=2488810 RepID=A0A4U7JHE2_9FIRM|nr:DEAD/DEAH box helicase family protein [Ruminiclostridium herbifermentans]QNU66020.1 DEAD/DEAH box helicase family protein [Ruminiclostridium herbifermentans]
MLSQNALITNTNSNLLPHLKEAIRNSNKIKILVAFIKESGVDLIIDDLVHALRNGAQIQILTGYYLGITEPSALYLLKMKLGECADIRIYKHTNISFHPKTYIFQDDHSSEIFIGSSNISESALRHGVEWNYKIVKSNGDEDISQFIDSFENLFENHSFKLDDEALKNYSIGWKLNKQLYRTGKEQFEQEKECLREIAAEAKSVQVVKPYGAQIEALYYLNQTRDEGMQKGLVVMATGVGKTYLAAFDSQKFNRILFVAHREEILIQACKSFENVMPDKSLGFFKASNINKDADVIFASVQTLGKDNYLNETYFKPDDFDYIIIDEFHHVAANTYRCIVDYFKPKFLLGLTATPFRMDNKDIFEYCDDNLVYEINLKEAIERDYLVPFKYYGVYDDTDYSKIDFKNGIYNEKELEKALSVGKRADLVFKYYKMFNLNKTVAFCCSANHANFMASEFNKSGIKAVTVHTGDGEYKEQREKAVELLKSGEIQVIFVVDIFNEGVDIPEIDSVLFLRPTESYTVFIQQLGRGLRKFPGKSCVTVLDFIGNYKRAYILPILLSGKNPMCRKYCSFVNVEYPEGCNVQFDLKLIDLFEELKKREKLSVRIGNEYYRLKEALGKRPTRTDIFEGSDIKAEEFIKLKKGYLGLLAQLGELNDEEKSWIGTDVEGLFYEIETMKMDKLYKIPTLRTFIKGEKLCKKVSADEVAISMKAFYQNPRYSVDMQDKGSKDYMNRTIEDYRRKAIQMPIYHINKSSNYFSYDEINKEFYISDEILKFNSSLLAKHFSDILDYKLRNKHAKLYKKIEE